MVIPAEIAVEIERSASLHNVPPAIIAAVAHVESGFNPLARNPKTGAAGIMQIMPQNWATLGIADPYNAGQNLAGGSLMLSRLYSTYGDWSKVFAAYVWGRGNVKKNPDPSTWPEPVRAYVRKVLVRANLPVPFKLMRRLQDGLPC